MVCLQLSSDATINEDNIAAGLDCFTGQANNPFDVCDPTIFIWEKGNDISSVKFCGCTYGLCYYYLTIRKCWPHTHAKNNCNAQAESMYENERNQPAQY